MGQRKNLDSLESILAMPEADVGDCEMPASMNGVAS